jgi:hypothetical protein
VARKVRTVGRPHKLAGRGELHDVILRVAHIWGGETCQRILEYDQ